jgi:hypothetical protein
MSNFHSSFGAFAGADLGDFGAAGKPRKKAVSANQRTQLLKKYRWLRDEDEQLNFAYGHKMPKQAKAVFRKLARMRDHFRKKAMAVIAGRQAGQLAGRSYLALHTLGVSELARLALKKPIAKAHKARAVKILAKADACDMLLRYWAGKFRQRAEDLRKKAAKNTAFVAEFRAAAAAAQAGGAVVADGATEGAAPEADDIDITATVSASEEDDDQESGDVGGFMGLSGREVLAFGALGAFAGLAVS